MRYIFYTTVIEVFEKFQPVYQGGIGDDSIFKDKSMGWFIHFVGSWEALHVGPDKPDMEKGDKVKITLEKV